MSAQKNLFRDPLDEAVEKQEVETIHQRSQRDENLEFKALDSLHGFLKKRKRYEPPKPIQTVADALTAACAIVGSFCKIKIKPPSYAPLKDLSEELERIASSSGFRYRKISLEGEWWKKDLGPFLGFDSEGNPMAMIFSGVRGYRAIEPVKGASCRIHSGNASTFQLIGYYLYRPLPKESMNIRQLARFAIGSLKAKTVIMLILFGSVSGALNALIPVLIGYAMGTLIPAREGLQLIHLVLFLLCVGISSVLFELAKSLLSSKIEFRLDIQTQIALWDRLVDLPSSFFRKYTSGEIGKKVLGFYQMRIVLSNVISETFLSGIFSVFFLMVLFLYSTQMALIAISIALIHLIVALLVGLFQLRIGYDKLNRIDKLSGMMLEMFNAISKIRLSGAEKRAFNRWSSAYIDQKTKANQETMLHIGYRTFSTVLTIASSVIIFYLAYYHGELGIGEFVAFNSAFNSFMIVLASIASTTLSLSYALSLLKNIAPVLKERPETIESRPAFTSFQASVELRHVFFKYETNVEMILRDLSVTISEGEYVGIVGSSGSGKSTLLRLLLGFEKPASGRVYISQQDIQTVDLRSLRRHMGVVLQNSQLLSGNIYSNIAGAHPDITIDDIWRACELAGIKKEIESLPMGLFTFINENSGTFSGGQKQRILIARALIHHPKIILFDEATSALDNITQSCVTNTLKGLDCTRIVIAHRLSTVKDCDRILVMVKGEIVESGDYATLMDNRGAFYDLVKRQIL